ncbi:uncharacterized protein LOC143034060 [Oratosquilla oratoria]|uniref:uncharacterized protein LOC143034060 n=1 Tax=Oratosquilla oratoria TaxID=337810 RepID=UPI003F7638A9
MDSVAAWRSDSDNLNSARHDVIESAASCSSVSPTTLDEFSICLWFRANMFSTTPALLSYATGDEQDNTILINVFWQAIWVYYQEVYHFYVDFEVILNKWHHLCLVREVAFFNDTEKTSLLFLYVDGKEVNRFEGAGDKLLMNGSLVLGQDQDSLGGGFSATQAFIGDITLLRLWDKALNFTEVNLLEKCQGEDINPLLEWEDFTWDVQGDVVNISSDPCKERGTSLTILIPKLVNLESARQFCALLNMTLPIPQNDLENSALGSAITSSPFECHAVETGKMQVWLAALFNESISHWVNLYDGSKLSYSPWGSSDLTYMVGSSKCVIMTNGGTWLDALPDSNACTVCEGLLPDRVFLLRGLCENEPAYKTGYMIFYARPDSHGILMFKGSMGLLIELQSLTWHIFHKPTNQSLAVYPYRTLPIGRHSWVMNDSRSVCFGTDATPRELGSTATLVISTCALDELTCGDGSCLPASCRCSQQLDCADGSDEADCGVLKDGIPSTYNNERPPPLLPFILTVAASLNKVSSVNIRDQLVRVKYRLHLQWFETRIHFWNLKENTKLNSIYTESRKSLWLPSIQVSNEERLEGWTAPRGQLLVARQGRPTHVTPDLRYSGEENPVLYELELSNYVHCVFDLTFYPYDVQHCLVTITFDNLTPGTFELSVNSSNIDEDLSDNPMEYVVESCQLFSQAAGDGFSISFVLRRRSTYHLFATYFPTALLHAIGYGTLMITTEDFQDRGTMSLTTLLVLISLYSDTLTELPNTSYLKYIDIWFIFSITYLTLIIAVHLATNDPSTPVQVFAKWRNHEKSCSSRVRRSFHMPKISNASALRAARFLLGFGYVGFMVVYWGSLYWVAIETNYIN